MCGQQDSSIGRPPGPFLGLRVSSPARATGHKRGYEEWGRTTRGMAEAWDSGPARGEPGTWQSRRSPEFAELTSLRLTPRQPKSLSKLRAPTRSSGAPLRLLRAARRRVLIGRALGD